MAGVKELFWRARMVDHEGELVIGGRALRCGAQDQHGRYVCQGVVAYYLRQEVLVRLNRPGIVLLREGMVQESNGVADLAVRARQRVDEGRKAQLRRRVNQHTMWRADRPEASLPLYVRCSHRGKHPNYVDGQVVKSLQTTTAEPPSS